MALRRPSCPFVDHSFSFAVFRLFQASVAPALPCRSSESETIRNRPIPLRRWYPVTVNLNTLVALRRPSWPFVDPSFSFVFFRLFQASRAPDDGADHTRKKLPIVFKDEPRMDTNRDGPPSITNRARMYLRYRDLDIPTSWEGATRERGRPARFHIPAISLRSTPLSCKEGTAGDVIEQEQFGSGRSRLLH